MPLTDKLGSKLLYGALVVGAIAILAYNCNDCSCECRGMDRFRQEEAVRSLEERISVVDETVEKKVEYEYRMF
ncbi:MAG: hypothetical protein Q8R53_05140 [Nanoarchaeota archaeon]|nr:hypothetical protein [Nanoarchaeota archaeon]